MSHATLPRLFIGWSERSFGRLFACADGFGYVAEAALF